MSGVWVVLPECGLTYGLAHVLNVPPISHVPKDFHFAFR